MLCSIAFFSSAFTCASDLLSFSDLCPVNAHRCIRFVLHFVYLPKIYDSMFYDLVTNTYNSAGNLTRQTYGNGDYVDYAYDHLGRLKTSSTSDDKDIEYFYTGDGQLSRVVSGTEATEYTYDTLGRLVASTTSDSNAMRTQLWQEYNENNQLAKQVLNFVDKSYFLGYSYDSYGRLTTYTAPVGNTSIGYDALSRIGSITYPHYKATYTYTANPNNSAQTTTLVSKLALTANSNSFVTLTYQYTYDGNGNILTITDPLAGNRVYTYDEQGQILTETIGSKTYTYTYDTYGNIRTANGITYTYGDSTWLDRLTAYDGGSISYDAFGNPTSYYNGTRWTQILRS